MKLGALGDAVNAFPLVSALKSEWPGARVTWIVEARLADLPRLHPRVDEVVTVDTRGWRRDLRRGRLGAAWSGVRDFARSVAGRFDVAVDAQGLLKSAAVTWLTRAPIRVGFSAGDCRERGNAWAMTLHAAPVGAVHAVTKNSALLAALRVRGGAPRFDVRIPAADEAWASPYSPVVTIHPGAGHPGKRWPLQRWLALSERLSASGRRVVIVTGPDDRATVDEAVAAMARAPEVAAPPTVGALAALLRRTAVAVAGDTGPLHLAAALGRRTVGVYGPSDPMTAAPFGDESRVIKHACACGWRPGPSFNRRCAASFACMRAIEVDEVAEAVAGQIDAAHAQGPSAVG
ncbi:MAG: glycosyltransferase family 9 protein [Nitrospirota bacterium]